MKSKNILVCISGLTPQIVTETIYGLYYQHNVTVNEIFILTTARGNTVLSGKDDSPNTPKDPLSRMITLLAKEIGIKRPTFTNSAKHIILTEEESVALSDIRSDNDNVLFPNKAAELIRDLTSVKEHNVYASLSGGRKSMSAHLALTMSMFAKPQDKLYHVLTDEQYEFANFYPKTEKEKLALVISEIPFVRLRSINFPHADKNADYSSIVQSTQTRLDFVMDRSKLVIDLRFKTIRFKDRSITLTPTQIALYFVFAEKNIESTAGFSIGEIQSIEFALNLKSVLTEYYNQYFDETDKNHWHRKGLSAENFRQLRSKINSSILSLFTDDFNYKIFSISSRKEWGNTQYIINAPKSKIGINYE